MTVKTVMDVGSLGSELGSMSGSKPGLGLGSLGWVAGFPLGSLTQAFY